MSAPTPPPEQDRATVLRQINEALLRLLPLIGPEAPYSRAIQWVITIVALGFALAAMLSSQAVTVPTDTRPGVLPGEVVRASMVTADYRDLDLMVDRRTGQATIIRRTVPLATGDSAPAAPLMDWDNQDVRQGNVMRWCLTGLDPTAARELRAALAELAKRFPPEEKVVLLPFPHTERGPGIRWEEKCPGSYTAGNTAAQDCGAARPEDVVACAVYEGPRAGRVSVSQFYADRFPGGSWLGLAVAHEVQHLMLNLGHNPCGTVLDPITREPVASAMSPLDVARGQSCSQPPATGLTPADWHYAYDYYGLSRTPPGAPPTVTPTLAPTPSPTPTPPPTPTPVVVARVWVESSRTQDGTVIFDGYWRVLDTALPPPPPDGKGAAYSFGVRRPDGSIDWGADVFRRIVP